MIKQMLNPNLYHGKHPWNTFEGWYYKLTDDNNNSFAFIPGVCWGKNPKEAHSFLQVLEGNRINYTYNKYSPSDFKANQRPFSVQVKDSLFSFDGLSLNVNNEANRIQGELHFSKQLKWPDSFYSPGSMGFFNFIPFLQCYSQVCIMSMEVKGRLYIDGIAYTFDKGKGYIEKNWGSAFPYSWVWVQSNSFNDKTLALSCSIGHIPFLSTSFRGFLVGLQYKEDFLSFTTMNRSRLRIIPQNKDLMLELINNKYELIIKTMTDSNSFILCNGPRDGKMVPLVKECLKGEVYIQLKKRNTDNIILEDIGDAAGIEYGGDQMKMLDSI